MPVRLCFENKKNHLVIKRKKITAIGVNSDFFPPYFDGTLFVYISLCKYTHTLLLLTIYIYIKSISARK